MLYIHRNAEYLLTSYLKLFPCVAVTGPRQSGKSTMVRHCLPGASYVTFDDPDEELAFRSDPKGFLLRFSGQTIFDEVQRVPELFRYLKMAIDEAPDLKGRFILTGSNQINLGKGISESLAGRIGYLKLLPFETREIPSRQRSAQILFGSYPSLVMNEYAGAREWFAAYLATYLEKDIRLLFDIGKLTDFQRLVRLLAARTSQEQNSASLARDIGVSAKTIEAWISILEAGYIVFRLEPFHANIGKRIIKRPKFHFWDTGLACYLSGLRTIEALEQGPLSGPLFESMVVAEIIKKATHSGLADSRDFFYYRDNAGNEIDLVVHDQNENTVTFIEIKSGCTAKPEWAYQLQKVSAILKPAFSGSNPSFRHLVIYRGETRNDWPSPGFDFQNSADYLLSK